MCNYWADLQSVHGFRCYNNIARTRNVSECLSYVDTEAARSGAAGDRRQWAFGYGVGWGESGWGLHQYSGWGIGATNYTDELDEPHSLPAQQTDTLDDSRLNEQVTRTALVTE